MFGKGGGSPASSLLLPLPPAAAASYSDLRVNASSTFVSSSLQRERLSDQCDHCVATVDLERGKVDVTLTISE